MIKGTITITEDGVISVIHPSSEGGLKLDGRMAMTTTPVHPSQSRSVKNIPHGVEVEIELIEELVNPMGRIVDPMNLSQNQSQCKWQRFALLVIGEISIPPENGLIAVDNSEHVIDHRREDGRDPISFLKWVAKDWMNIWVVDKWMWEWQHERTPETFKKYKEYYTEEELYLMYLQGIYKKN